MITSTQNEKIKNIRKLRGRKERDQSGLFFAEGIRIVTEAVQLGTNLEAIIFSPELLTSTLGRQIIDNADDRCITVLEVDKKVFKSISSKESPQGIAAVIHQQWHHLDTIYSNDPELWVAIDSVQDPGNLGTVIRTNEAVGGRGLILLDRSTDPYSPTSIRASMGAIFSQALVRTTGEAFREWKQRENIAVFGTSGYSDQIFNEIYYPDKVVLLMGSEREGLHPQFIELCDEIVKIPMVGRSDSLNLAVATGVVLYEVYSQRAKRLK